MFCLVWYQGSHTRPGRAHLCQSQGLELKLGWSVGHKLSGDGIAEGPKPPYVQGQFGVIALLKAGVARSVFQWWGEWMRRGGQTGGRETGREASSVPQVMWSGPWQWSGNKEMGGLETHLKVDLTGSDGGAEERWWDEDGEGESRSLTQLCGWWTWPWARSSRRRKQFEAEAAGFNSGHFLFEGPGRCLRGDIQAKELGVRSMGVGVRKVWVQVPFLALMNKLPRLWNSVCLCVKWG